MKRITEIINEGFAPVHYDEDNFIVTYNLKAIADQTHDKSYDIVFNDLMLGVNSKQFAYKWVEVDADFGADILVLRVPGSGDNRKMRVWSFKSRKPLEDYYKQNTVSMRAEDLEPTHVGKPYNMTGQNPDLDQKIAELLALVFNSEPEPLFNNPIKKMKR